MIAYALDVILILVLAEGAALALYNRRTGKGIALPSLAANLAAGFCLMLAVRLALAGSSETLIAACLMAALVAHVLDLAARWRGRE